MNIAMVVPMFVSIGGVETHVRMLSDYLVRRGHSVSIITTDAVDRQPLKRIMRKPASLPFSLFEFPCYGFLHTYFPFSPRMYLFLLSRAGDFDLVHAHGFGHVTSDVAFLAARMRSIPFVLTTHGIHQDVRLEALKSLLWMSYQELVAKSTVPGSDAVIALTHKERPYLKSLGVESSRIHVIPNAVDLPEYCASLKPKYSDDRSLTIVYLGRIDPSKGLEYLADAISRIPHARLVLAGPRTAYSEVLAQMVDGRGLGGRVTQLGAISEQDKFNLLASCDIFCMPSKYEAFSIATVEAMALGKACVATRVGGLTSIIRDGINGLLVDYGDTEDLVKAINRLSEDRSLREALGKEAMRSVKSFRSEAVFPMIEDVYLKVTRKK